MYRLFTFLFGLTKSNSSMLFFFLCQVCQDGCAVQRVWICGAYWCCQYGDGYTSGHKSWQSPQEVQCAGEQKHLVFKYIAEYYIWIHTAAPTHSSTNTYHKCRVCWHNFMLGQCLSSHYTNKLVWPCSILRCTVTTQRMETFSTASSVHTKTRTYELGDLNVPPLDWYFAPRFHDS